MLLNGANICYYLLDKGYLSVKSIVDGDFSVHLTPSRNSNFIINKAQEPSFFVKQASGLEREKQESLRHEATCYWLANFEEEYQSLKAFLPEYHEYDYINHILVVDFLQDAMPLNHFYYQTDHFPLEVAEKKAALLASFHKDIYTQIKNTKSFSLFKQSIPAVFMLVGNRQQYWTRGDNAAERQMLDLINQTPDFSEMVEKVRSSWEASSLIHCDIKSANFLITYKKDGPVELRLIDWEMADVGDPCWDVAALFQIYFLLYIYADIKDEAKGKDRQTSELTLQKMKPALRHFWQCYVEKMNFSEEDAKARLLKTMNFCALKLIHTCYESTVSAKELPASSAKMLQLSLNILQSPTEAVAALMGIKF